MSTEPAALPDPAPHMSFVGVSTAGSSIMRVFPRWADELGLPTRQLVGHDLPLDATRQQYRDLVTGLRDDPDELGALVTTHKIGVHTHCADLFDELDPFADLCGEISSISKRDGRFVAHAKDPVTAGLALEEFLPPGHFAATGAEVLCLGAGGAGTAATWYLAGRPDRPRRIVCTDTDPGRLDHLRDVHQRGGLDGSLFDYRQVASAAEGDPLLAERPAGSLIINATGLGKDRPGSPLTDAARFPDGAIAWELNYRGSLEFLHQAQSRSAVDGLLVVDGWRYFIHGWSQVVAEVFDLSLDPATVQRLSDLAETVR